MKATNLPNGAQRGVEVGFVWEQIAVGGSPTFEVPAQGTIRVHAIAQTLINIGGVDAITLEADETELLNVGTGAAGDNKSSVTVIVTGTANVSRAKEIESGRRSKQERL